MIYDLRFKVTRWHSDASAEKEVFMDKIGSLSWFVAVLGVFTKHTAE